MKTRLQREELLDALTAISSLTSGRTPKPILACGKLSTRDDMLEVCATDGEAALRLTIPTLAVEKPGETVVPADRLLGIVRELADVELTLEADERQCVLRATGGTFKIYVQNPADFPPIPVAEGDPDLVLDGHLLRRMIELTLYAAARETSRYAINGVLWDKCGKQLYLVATDGRRLARAGGRLISANSADFDVILPTKALSVFERVFVPPKESDAYPVQVFVSPNQAVLAADGRLLSTALVEGRFPKYEDVIPKEHDRRATLDSAEFYAAVKRAALLTTEDSRTVRLAFSENQLVISSHSPEQGEAHIELGVEYVGEPMEIGFNPTFLSDVMKVFPYEQVRIEMQENNRPGVFCGENKEEFLYVVMPVSLGP